MIEIEDAWKLIGNCRQLNSIETLPLNESVGSVTACPVYCDSDSPPFSKSLVDGYAVGNSPLESNRFAVAEIITAGNVPTKEISSGVAAQIMTGAPIPVGTVGVVMVEETSVDGGEEVVVYAEKFSRGQNILEQGAVAAKSQVLVESGHRLRSHHTGALAEFGIDKVDVFKRTTVAVLATGDELVLINEKPGPGQIRNSNGLLISSMAKSSGAIVQDLGIGRDDELDLKQKIVTGLKQDILVIAGGVSAGVLDLVPKCLRDLGVEQVFHKINLKPGKPLWFGMAKSGTLVFGLPGNPVSSLVCFRLFVEPTIQKMAGASAQAIFETAALSEDFHFGGGRRTFWPSKLKCEDMNPQMVVEPLNWIGSADQVRFLQSDVLVELDGERRTVEAGELVKFVRHGM